MIWIKKKNNTFREDVKVDTQKIPDISVINDLH